MTRLDKRRTLYTELSSQLTVLNNRQLSKLVKTIPNPAGGWGSNGVIQMGKRNVFVKRIPITDLEFEHPYETKNIFKLPTYYNYGLGSFGLGAYREIIPYIKTTNWVLDGSCPLFPILFHHRIIPLQKDKQKPDPKSHTDYIRYWNNNQNVGAYKEARTSASHQAILFIEHFPQVLRLWLRDDLKRVARTVPRALEILSFLQSNGIIHFDAHHWNFVTDGRYPYLTDFGVVSDLSYQLTKPEQAFHHRNTHYGAGEFLSNAVGYAFQQYNKIGPRKREPVNKVCDLNGDESQETKIHAITSNIEKIVSMGLMKFPRSYVDVVIKYREIGNLYRSWEQSMKRGSRKNIRYDNTAVKNIIAKARK